MKPLIITPSTVNDAEFTAWLTVIPFRNFHFSGEAASTNNIYLAFVNGLLISLSPNADMSLFYRNISKGYQSLYTNAFTENNLPSNEKGLFAGITLRPASSWQIDAYADMYKFPWLKFGVNAPSTGKDYFVQVTYRPNKQVELYSRLKSESKADNFNPEGLVLSPVIQQPRQNWRMQASYKISREFTLRSRTEMVWFDKKGKAASNGFMIYGDLLYKPMLKPYGGNIRLQYFETDDYNSRLYSYENDVLYYYSIPVLYDKGYRYYINMNYELSKKITLYAKWSQYLYPDKDQIGSGLDLINSDHKSELRLQGIFRF